MSNVSNALARWYANHAPIRRLWAVDEADALVVFVALEPSSDGDDALPVWLANRHNWTDDLRQAIDRDVQLKLVSGAFETADVNAEAITIAELSWRDPWES